MRDTNVVLDNLLNINVFCLFKVVAILPDGEGLGLVTWSKMPRYDIFDFTIKNNRINYVREMELSDKEFDILVKLCDLDLKGLKKFAQGWKKYSK